MRKIYYAYYPRNFSNEFFLYSVETDEDQKAIKDLLDRISYNPNATLERVSAKEILHLQKAERDRRKEDPSFAGYCCTVPIPAREM